jgi:uncharacterized protein (TIGR03437 family)
VKLRSSLFLTLFLAACASLSAFSTGPPPMRSGVPGEADGLTCNACHRGTDLNSDTRGRLTIEAGAYKPGVKQNIKIKLEHPEAMRWGFQVTVRLASNPLQGVGTFTASPIRRVVCSGGGAQPCPAGQNEFITHVASVTFPGQRNGAEWDLEWTPPATASGNLIIFAAGNASNNSGTSGAASGDIIYNTNRMIGAENCDLAKPTITAVRNAGSFIDGPLSLNTLIAIGGTGLQAAGTTRNVSGADINDGKFPTELSCMAVEVAGRRAALTYAQANQVNAQIPTVSAVGASTVVAIANPGTPNERRSDPFAITLAANSPAFFRLLPTPCIAAIFANTGQVTGDPSLLQGVRGVRPGDIIAMFATGLGVLDPVYQAGEVIGDAVRLKDTVTVEWAGTALPASEVLYSGSAPGLLSGVYQINIRVPAAVTSNAQNQVRMRVGGVLSPEGTTIFVAAQ